MHEVTKTVADVLEVEADRVTVVLHELPADRISVGGVTLEKRRG